VRVGYRHIWACRSQACASTCPAPTIRRCSGVYPRQELFGAHLELNVVEKSTTLGSINVLTMLWFQVINIVGAFSLQATLNCEEFANVHSSSAHYDPKSFVGLAWRPADESICCGKFQDLLIIFGVFTTIVYLFCMHRNIWHWKGKVSLFATIQMRHLTHSLDLLFVRSLPGATVERDLQSSLSRMFPELLRFSSSSRLLALVPENIRDVHHREPNKTSIQNSSTLVQKENIASSSKVDLWEDWDDAEQPYVGQDTKPYTDDEYSDDDDGHLSDMGF